MGTNDPEYDRRYRAARKAAGLCWSCKARAAKGSRYCDACREKNAARAVASQNARAASGLCVKCCAPLNGKPWECDACLAKRRERYAGARRQAREE